MIYRDILKATDREAFKDLLESTGVFYDFEIDVAIEIVDVFLEKGEASGYYFYAAEEEGRVRGYVNFGPTPCTKASWDVYWIAVSKQMQGKGLGASLLKMAEDKIASLGGQNIWIETSSRVDYLPTRSFYLKKGYVQVSELPEFYGPDDNKVILAKFLKKEGGSVL